MQEPPRAMSVTPPPAPPASGRGVFQAALRGLCPRCDNKTLFDGWVRFAPHCRACGLDFSAFNVGDGPAAFLTLGVGALLTALAVWLELSAAPPFWVHLLLWVPIGTIAVVGSLRVAKALLLILEYRRGAAEARLRKEP